MNLQYQCYLSLDALHKERRQRTFTNDFTTCFITLTPLPTFRARPDDLITSDSTDAKFLISLKENNFNSSIHKRNNACVSDRNFLSAYLASFVLESLLAMDGAEEIGQRIFVDITAKLHGPSPFATFPCPAIFHRYAPAPLLIITLYVCMYLCNYAQGSQRFGEGIFKIPWD